MNKQNQTDTPSGSADNPRKEKQPSEPQTEQVNKNQTENENYLTKEDLPDATNESKGKMGSGQRQDSN